LEQYRCIGDNYTYRYQSIIDYRIHVYFVIVEKLFVKINRED